LRKDDGAASARSSKTLKVVGGKPFSEHFVRRRRALLIHLLAGLYVEKGQKSEARQYPADIFETC
jgi:hypothetical protein